MTSLCSRSPILHASVVLLCTASVVGAQRASTELRTTRATYPPYAGDTSGKARHVNLRVTGETPEGPRPRCHAVLP